MTEREVGSKIWYKIYETLLDILAKGNAPCSDFEKIFEQFTDQKARGERTFYPVDMLPTFSVAFLVAVANTITRRDGDATRYNIIGKEMAIACAAVCGPRGDCDATTRMKEFNTLANNASAFLRRMQSANPEYYLSFGKDGQSESERLAYADQAWSLIWLETVILGKYFKKERIGELCIPFFTKFIRDLADFAEKTMVEYFNPEPPKTDKWITYAEAELKPYAKDIFELASKQAEDDWEYIETTIWGHKYPHRAHKDVAIADLIFAYSVGSVFRACLGGDRKKMPRMQKLQMIAEVANCMRKHSDWYCRICDIQINSILSRQEKRDIWSEEREKNCRKRFSESISWGKFGERSEDMTEILALLGELTGDVMNSFDEDGGFLYRKNEKCARLVASRIDTFYGTINTVLIDRCKKLNENTDPAYEIMEMQAPVGGHLMIKESDESFEFIQKAIAFELERANRHVGLYPKGLETIVCLAWNKYSDLEAQENAGNELCSSLRCKLYDNIIGNIHRDKISMILD